MEGRRGRSPGGTYVQTKVKESLRVCDGVIVWLEHKCSRFSVAPPRSAVARLPTYFFIFFLNFAMVGIGSQTLTPAAHIANIDARLFALLSGLGLHEKSISRLSEIGVHTTYDLHTLVDDRKDLRVFVKNALGLDPDPAKGGYEATIEQGKIIQAWEQAGKRVEVENKRDAERLASNLPPQLTAEDVLLLKKQFETNFNKGRAITKAQTPSKAYLELKVGHAETLWEAEKLSEMTSLAQSERHRLKNATDKQMG